MTQVVFAPKRDYYLGNMTVFLAGAIDMGKAVNWQAWIIESLTDVKDMTIYNPRRLEEFTPDMMDEQINWELDLLNAVDCIFMWFPKDALAPIALFESGLFWNSKKMIVGAEQGFYRRRNLELTANYYHVNLYGNLDEMVSVLKDKSFAFIVE